MRPTYSLDVPVGSYLRCASVGGETMFLLATRDASEGEQLACRVVAFDLACGRERASLVVPYIKHDNGGGSLSAAPTGDRVALGSEFGITIYDIEGGAFCQRAYLDTEQSVCTAKFFDPDRVIHWNISHFVVTDLRSGDQQIGPELDETYGDLDPFVIEPDGEHLLVLGRAVGRHRERQDLLRVSVRDLDVVELYEIEGYVMVDPVVDTRGRAYLVSGDRLLMLDMQNRAWRVLHRQLHGSALCMRLHSDTRLDIVTRREWVVFDVAEGVLIGARPFPHMVEAAGFDGRGRLWVFDERQVLREVEPPG